MSETVDIIWNGDRWVAHPADSTFGANVADLMTARLRHSREVRQHEGRIVTVDTWLDAEARA